MGPMEMGWFPIEQNGVGATGTLIKGEGYTPSFDGSMVYFSVGDIEATLTKIESNGGKTLMGKTSILIINMKMNIEMAGFTPLLPRTA